VTLVLFPITSLSDESGGNVPIDAFSAGLITINADSEAVPEPSSLALLLSGVAAGTAAARRQKKARAQATGQPAQGVLMRV
jgi:hypothetical protein